MRRWTTASSPSTQQSERPLIDYAWSVRTIRPGNLEEGPALGLIGQGGGDAVSDSLFAGDPEEGLEGLEEWPALVLIGQGGGYAAIDFFA